jgi:hypothetical protein
VAYSISANSKGTSPVAEAGSSNSTATHEAVSGGGVSAYPIATAFHSESRRARRAARLELPFLLVPAVLALLSLPGLAPVAHSMRPLVVVIRRPCVLHPLGLGGFIGGK